MVYNRKEKNLHVTLGTRPNQNKLAEAYQYGKSHFDLLGLIVEDHNIDAQESLDSNVEIGVIIVEVAHSSASRKNNILPGDIIIEIGRIEIKNLASYKNELSNYKAGNTIMLRILRNNSPIYIAFEIQ